MIVTVRCHPSDSEGAKVTEQREGEPTRQASPAVTTLVGPGTPLHAYFMTHYQKSHSLVLPLSQSAQAAVTKYHRLCGLNHRHLLPTVWRLGSPRPKCQLIWLQIRMLLLACQQHPSHCVLTKMIEREEKREGEKDRQRGLQSFQ